MRSTEQDWTLRDKSDVRWMRSQDQVPEECSCSPFIPQAGPGLDPPVSFRALPSGAACLFPAVTDRAVYSAVPSTPDPSFMTRKVSCTGKLPYFLPEYCP